MASSKVEKKQRKRKSKARTQGRFEAVFIVLQETLIKRAVSSSSSSSSSDSEGERERRAVTLPQPTTEQRDFESANSSADEQAREPDVSKETPPNLTQSKRKNPDQTFDDFYLRQATKEFANDLEKLRSAGDFHGEKSVGMLIEALRQGNACFGVEERRRIGGVGGGGGGVEG